MSNKLYRQRMAPGSSSMLRSRRRDVNVKPNRVLDRNSSRGMIYENEELRLRTININAEVERGQNDIKKLRRENDHLRREIWSLREEYDRLEALLKRKQEQSEDAEESEDEDSDEKDEADQENATNQQKVTNKDIDMLSVVEEEPEEISTEGEEKQSGQHLHKQLAISDDEDDSPPPLVPITFPMLTPPHGGEPGGALLEPEDRIPTNGVTSSNLQNHHHAPHNGLDNHPGRTSAFPNGSIPAIFPNDLEQLLRNFSVASPTDDRLPGMARPSIGLEHYQPVNSNADRRSLHQSSVLPSAASAVAVPTSPSGDGPRRGPDAAAGRRTPNGRTSSDRRCEPYAGQNPAVLRLNSVQPHTLFFPVAGSEFADLTVQEVIDTLTEQLDSDLSVSLRGVRLVGGACYLSLATDEDSNALMRSELSVRGTRLRLEDASAGTAFINLAGVPHDVTDEAVAAALAPFGAVLGGVERRLYRGVDTGERLARLRPRLAVPRFLWLGGCKVCLRTMKPDEINALVLARRRSFRSHLHVRLRPVPEDGCGPPPIPPLPGQDAGPSTSKQPFFSTVTQSVPNLVPCLSAPPPIGFSTTQSVPDLTMRPPPPDPPPKPQFFSSTDASDIFMFPPPPQGGHEVEGYGPRRHSSILPPPSCATPSTSTQVAPGDAAASTTPPTAGSQTSLHHQRSHSTPPVRNASPLLGRRQNSQSDTDTPKPPSPSPSKTRHRPTRKSSTKANSQPNLTPLDTKKANGDASSSSGQDSPSKPGRRRASVYFKRPGSLRRQASVEQVDGTAGELTTTCSERERSNSDVSSRTSGGGCRRKLSTTGREVGKVPWCGCWGNGCL